MGAPQRRQSIFIANGRGGLAATAVSLHADLERS
jgi:hypothetical protein